MILIPDTISAQQLEKIQASFTNHEVGEGGNPGGPEGAHPQGGQHPQGATHPRNRWRCMQPRVCEYCWKTFSNSFNLKQHIVNVHIQSQGVACTMCEKVQHKKTILLLILILDFQVVKNKWYLRKHLVTAHGAPLKRAKGSPAEPKTTEVNEKEVLKPLHLQKSENIFEFSEGRPAITHVNQQSDEQKQMEKQNDEDINEELNVDN